MRTLTALLLTACLIVTMTVTSGCKKETPKGGPGATTTAVNPTTTGGARAEDNTFSVKVPSSVKVNIGESADFSVTVKRGSAFNQNVTVTLKTDKAVDLIKIQPSSAVYKTADNDKTFTVSADAKAQEGDHTVTVVGTPAEGAAVSETFTVQVKKK